MEGFRRGTGADIQIIADASDPNTANALTSYATAIIRGWQAEKIGIRELPLTIKTDYQMTYNPELKGVFLFVPGVMTMILMMVSTLMTSIAVAREKELGTMEVLLVSPLNPTVIIVGKVIPYLGLGMINAGVIVLLSNLVFGIPIHGSVLLLMAECLLFVVTALAMGIMISTVANSQQTAMLFSLDDFDVADDSAFGLLFPDRKHADDPAGIQQYPAGQVVHYHCERHHAQGFRLFLDLARVLGLVWDGCIFHRGEYFPV
jgi:ABC-2 type transport system permease protein